MRSVEELWEKAVFQELLFGWWMGVDQDRFRRARKGPDRRLALGMRVSSRRLLSQIRTTASLVVRPTWLRRTRYSGS